MNGDRKSVKINEPRVPRAMDGTPAGFLTSRGGASVSAPKLLSEPDCSAEDTSSGASSPNSARPVARLSELLSAAAVMCRESASASKSCGVLPVSSVGRRLRLRREDAGRLAGKTERAFGWPHSTPGSGTSRMRAAPTELI